MIERRCWRQVSASLSLVVVFGELCRYCLCGHGAGFQYFHYSGHRCFYFGVSVVEMR